ncbi:unnamed protein product [Lepidochelys kempii]
MKLMFPTGRQAAAVPLETHTQLRTFSNSNISFSKKGDESMGNQDSETDSPQRLWGEVRVLQGCAVQSKNHMHLGLRSLTSKDTLGRLKSPAPWLLRTQPAAAGPSGQGTRTSQWL